MGALGLAAACVLAAGCCALSAPRHQGPPSDHFDGSRFFNPGAHDERGVGAMLRWMTHRHPGPWRKWTDAPRGRAPVRRVEPGAMRVTFIGHSTVLLQMDGLNVLTDPVWSDSVGPISGIGPRRHCPPGLYITDLPPIDVVLVSHDHYDHLDLPTLESLAEEHHPRVVTGLGNGALLESHGIGRGIELDWWQSVDISSPDGRALLRVTSVPAKHFSMRGVCDRNESLWSGFVITGPSGSVFFAGDTGYGPHFRAIASRVGSIRLALLPIGAFRPREFMGPVHMSPDEAALAHRDLGARTSMAIHFGTFAQADDGQDEPATDLVAALQRANELRDRFWILANGESRDVPRADVAIDDRAP